MVIADTSVWIPFFNRPGSPEKATLDILIDADEIALVGVVLAELLQGCRTESERHSLSDVLAALRSEACVVLPSPFSAMSGGRIASNRHVRKSRR